MSKLYEQFHAVTKPHKLMLSPNDFTHGPLLKLLQTHIGKRKLEILDIGCGAGAVDFYLAKQGHQVTGIDISKRAVASCHQNASYFGVSDKTDFKVATLENFKTNTKFDLITLIEVIEHLPNDEQSLKNIFKLLKPKGLLILTTPSLSAPLYRLGLLKKFDDRVGHLRRYHLPDLVALVTASGFNLIFTQKTEGLVRNSLFTLPLGGLVLRLVNRFTILKQVVIGLDKLSLMLFGESDLIIVAQKP